ncbi:hypothetical protein [Paenibacillus glacialis]|uniref:Cyclic nucleotide-binding domain-containing protein n=1 Tax=Paenibacillus glacialis TaxID=494026 RepID=A0A168MCM9_9BACL|nr:hypothetical protein [Paenibacillus glacialis]OAB44515.1 hypothetical protein PGLA_07625 [Paenibacillus glacialis]
MPETVPISGKAILDAVPGNVLLIYAIEKLLLEGKTRHEITDKTQEIAFVLSGIVKEVRE